MQRFSPKGERSKPYIRLPSQEEEHPECLALKVSKTHIQESWRTIGNRLALKGLM